MRLPVMFVKFAPAARADPLPQQSDETTMAPPAALPYSHTHNLDGFSADLKLLLQFADGMNVIIKC